MKTLLKWEEAAMLAVCILLLTRYPAGWWWYLLLAAGPDISMLGYLGGNINGAFFYNLFHHKGVAVAVFLIGIYGFFPVLELTGIILFGHASLDRFLGFGLKTEEGFRYTHLGIIGKKKT